MADQEFQSTLSVRRATQVNQHIIECYIFQSTLSVRRATIAIYLPAVFQSISIHALRKESDPPVIPFIRFVKHFNPRSP